ncbi:hypothetical protein [Thalassotalea euphylliae]|uniref:Uncharacterized protein n=1 Tax=Thalassotalea euphylliae TaxID=1655234 RepID=A0A3E0TX07_9GAMM|nr:hypothetical protein [Thalassotalea euphylliae]REL24444.1 hypothetical protein DXX94_19095 [Thalassotalea euphylliae]REL29241.1 hypothetical protein DXX94_00010 [Thalassotalea euphylliae]
MGKDLLDEIRKLVEFCGEATNKTLVKRLIADASRPLKDKRKLKGSCIKTLKVLAKEQEKLDLNNFREYLAKLPNHKIKILKNLSLTTSFMNFQGRTASNDPSFAVSQNEKKFPRWLLKGIVLLICSFISVENASFNSGIDQTSYSYMEAYSKLKEMKKL